MTRVVVFGGSGFIGRHIAERLGPDEFIAPSRQDADLLSRTHIEAVLRPGDTVINAAGYPGATDRSVNGLALLRAANVDAVENLARAGVAIGIGRLIHISSVAAMGRLTGVDRREDDEGPVTSPYAQSKRDAEAALAEVRGIPVTILRPTSVFGEGRGLARMLSRVARLPAVPLPSGGATLVPFSYVGNVADAIALAAKRDRPLEGTYIVGDEHSYPLRQIVVELGHHLGANPQVLPVPEWAFRWLARIQRVLGRRAGAALLDEGRLGTLTLSVSYSIKRFQSATGYAPRYSLSDALRRIAAWHMAHGAP